MAQINTDNLLQQANTAELACDWAEARSLYARVLDIDPDHSGAREAQDNVDAKQKLEEQLQAEIDNIEPKIVAQDYVGALNAIKNGEALLVMAVKREAITNNATHYQTKINYLREQVELAQQILQLPVADGVALLNKSVPDWRNDPVLEALGERLENRAKAEAQELLTRSENALEVGDVDDAVELLRQAYTLVPGDSQIADRYAQLKRRRDLENRIEEIELDFQTKLKSRSEVDARNTLRKGLELFLAPETGMPVKARRLLQSLLELDERGGGLAFGLPQAWEQAQDQLARFTQMAIETESWVVQQAHSLAQSWIRIARDVALQGVIASSAQLGDTLGAYRAACTRVLYHPNDEESIVIQAKTQSDLINQANDSASKRITRAHTALEAENFQVALDNLTAVEDEIYGPIEKEFPQILVGHDHIRDIRDETITLTQEAKYLRELYGEIAPKLDEAETALVNNQVDEAEAALQAIIHTPSEGSILARRYQSLVRRIAEVRQETQRRTINQAILTIQARLRQADTLEKLDALLDELTRLQEGIDLRTLPTADQQRYAEMAERIRQKQNELVTVDSWLEQAEAATKAGDHNQALFALNQALSATSDPRLKVKIQIELAGLQPRAEQQRALTEALERGRRLLDERKYSEARYELRRSQSLGAKVDDLIAVTLAGELLLSAQQQGEAQRWQDALFTLAEGLKLLENNSEPQAMELAREIESLKHQLEVKRDLYLDLQDRLKEARQALAAGNLDVAEAGGQEILRGFPDHAEAKKLVETVKQVKHLLNQAEYTARNNRFQQARQVLQQAVELGATTEYLNSVQTLIETLEEQWAKETIEPIHRQLQKARYVDALSQCKQALVRVNSDELYEQLAALQSEIIVRWGTSVLTDQRENLDQARSISELIDVINALDEILNVETPPPEKLYTELTALRSHANNAIKEKEIEQQLDEVERSIREDDVQKPHPARGLLKEVNDQLQALLGESPRRFSSRIENLEKHIGEIEQLAVSYNNGEKLLNEWRQDRNAEKLKQAVATLYQAIGECPDLYDSPKVEAKKAEAKELADNIIIKLSLKGDLQTLQEHLIFNMIVDPNDSVTWVRLPLVYKFRYQQDQIDNFANAEKRLQESNDERKRQLKGDRLIVHIQAVLWFIASLIAAGTAFWIFIWAINNLIETREPLTYLTPLLTLIPGGLSAIFFKQSTEANQRLDKGRSDAWQQIEGFERSKLVELEALRAKLFQDLLDFDLDNLTSGTHPSNTSMAQSTSSATDDALETATTLISS